MACLFIALLIASAAMFAQSSDPYQPQLPQPIVTAFEQAYRLRADGALDQAKQALHRILDEHSDYYLANYNLGLIYIELDLAELGVEYLQKAAAIRADQNIEDYSIYNTLGWVHMSLRRYADAERNYLRALEFEDDNPDDLNRKTYQNLGNLYYILQDTQLARKYLRVAVDRYASESAAETLQLVAELEKEQRLIQVNDGLQFTVKQGEYIGNKIWLNESNGDVAGLTAWNTQEGHASIGIGHFIWYPKGKEGPFQESFPMLLNLLKRKDIVLPEWLENDSDCPWDNQEAFLAALDSPRMNELRQLMQATFSEQVEFMTERFRLALPRILDALSDEGERAHVQAQFDRVARSDDGAVSAKGVYALLDYVHFKGEGISETERYNGEGWGLLQVLQHMQGDADMDARDEFAEAAYTVLARRVENNPPDAIWLKGWRKRVDTYRTTPRVSAGQSS